MMKTLPLVLFLTSFGAYAAPVPHTRPVSLMAIATTAELAAQVGVVAGTAEMPAGIQTALQEGFAAAGVPAIGAKGEPLHGARLPCRPKRTKSQDQPSKLTLYWSQRRSRPYLIFLDA